MVQFLMFSNLLAEMDRGTTPPLDPAAVIPRVPEEGLLRGTEVVAAEKQIELIEVQKNKN